MTIIPSFQSHGMRPVLQTDRNMEWSARATGMIANLSNSAGMPSGPGAGPFFNLRIAVMTSLRDGSSMEVYMSAAAFSASASRSGEGVPAG